MDDDTSNDVEAVEVLESQDDNDSDKRPIMLLLKRLIRNKQNTVMTNTQIIEILKREFDIEVSDCHELEVDIYIKIIKKYLKDWPQWEELERISSKLSNAKDFDAVTKVLNHKYKNLKEYLGVMLEAAKPLAKKAVADLETETTKESSNEVGNVVMEVYCTKDQLNHLIYRKPRSDRKNTIFNIAKIDPTIISLNTLTFESILNFWWTKIYLQLPNLLYFREVTYEFKHTLVNKVRDHKLPSEVLDTRVHNRFNKKTKQYPKTILYEYFERILQLCTDEHVLQLLRVIFHVLRTDLAEMPESFKVPSSYRKRANQYKYVRYLYVENDSESDKFDLQLEEVVTPSYQFYLGRLGRYPETLPPIKDWLKIECMMCKEKFAGSTELMSLMQAHFNDCHQNEPEWQCPHCKRLFSMDYLSKNRWAHEC